MQPTSRMENKCCMRNRPGAATATVGTNGCRSGKTQGLILYDILDLLQPFKESCPKCKDVPIWLQIKSPKTNAGKKQVTEEGGSG